MPKVFTFSLNILGVSELIPEVALKLKKVPWMYSGILTLKSEIPGHLAMDVY